MKRVIYVLMLLSLIVLGGCERDTKRVGYYSIGDIGSSKVSIVYNGSGVGKVTLYYGDYRNEYIFNTGDSEYIPMVYGKGKYRLIFEGGGKYDDIVIDVRHSDIKDVFTGESYCIKKTEEVEKVMRLLSSNVSDNYINNVYNYVCSLDYNNYTVDKIVNNKIKFYKVNLDEVLSSKSGICLDKAYLMSGLLRLRGIPSRVVYGYAYNGQYHAWVEVYKDDSWKLYDPTLYVDYNDKKSLYYKVSAYY
ncbi:MAG: transglutaminase-like domain-containing protein [Candidatus Anstonellales archaeon]